MTLNYFFVGEVHVRGQDEYDGIFVGVGTLTP